MQGRVRLVGQDGADCAVRRSSGVRRSRGLPNVSNGLIGPARAPGPAGGAITLRKLEPEAPSVRILDSVHILTPGTA